MRKKLFTVPIILNFITSLGASIVVFGALMKITHRSYADTFLTIGLVTESIIFCIYAFIPPKEEPNLQSLVEGLPKRVAGVQGTDINAEEMIKFNQHLTEANILFEKIKSTLRG